MTKRKSVIVTVFALTLALALCIALGMPAPQANAWRLEPEATVILDDGNGAFVKSELSKLYGQLVSGATTLQQLEAAATKVAADETSALGTGASDFSAPGTVASLGGKKWTPVHLTKDNDGNVILTLWLAWTTDVQHWSACSLDRYDWQQVRQTQYDAYPMNMYSSSYIRAYLNGTDYLAEAGATQLTKGSGVQSGEWKIFLSTFDKYLVAPEKIAYKQTSAAPFCCPGSEKIPAM